MWLRLRPPVIVLGATIAGCIALLIVGVELLPLPGDRDFARKFRVVRNGMTQAEVASLLGRPESTGREFRLSQVEGYEEAYAEAARSGAQDYWFWHRELDVTYAVGFDDSGRVVIAKSGG